MNAVRKARAQMQVALLIEAFRDTSNIPSLVGLAKDYSIHAEPQIINSSIKNWEDMGYLIVARDLSGYVGACLRRDSISDALEEVMEILDAEVFKVDWTKQEVITDAHNKDLIPARECWKLLELERVPPNAPQSTNSQRDSLPIQIVNTFAPVNNVTSTDRAEKKQSISWSGWLGVAVAIVSVIVALWIGGKI
jgi:hypothetical protein